MDVVEAGLDRRKFLKRAALGSLAVASLGPLTALPARASNGGGQLNFRWMSLSANEAGDELVVMNGDGFVNKGTVVASGSWNHNVAEPAPAELLGFGTWKATKLLSLDIIGTYGAMAAGTIVMEVNLIPDGGGGRIPAEVTMNCNIPPAGLFTGLAEGFFLSFDGMDFEPVVLPVAGGGPPPAIAVGATIFTLGVEQKN